MLSAVIFGPTLFLNLALTRMIPDQTGWDIDYDQARAGFLFRSAHITGLRLTPRNADLPLSAAEVNLEGLAAGKIISLIRAPSAARPAPAILAARVTVTDFRAGRDYLSLTVPECTAERLVLPADEEGRNQIPLLFARFSLRDFSFKAGEGLNFRISRLEARDLKQETLGSLKISALDFAFDGGGGRPAEGLRLEALTMGRFKTEAAKRAFSGRLDAASLPWLLAACDTLDAAQAIWSRGGREALNIRRILFDFNTAGPSGTVNYVRCFDFRVDLTALGAGSGEAVWGDLVDIAGPVVDMSLDLEADFNRQTGQINLRQAALASPTLGRLEAGGRLTGMMLVRPWLTPSQLLFANSALLENLYIDYKDQGLAAGLYRHFDRTIFRDFTGRSTADNLMIHYVKHLAGLLKDEQGLANLPSLISEAEAFLARPEAAGLTAHPASPFPLIALLANPDYYDIIEKLRLTVQVNNRAPVAVAVHSGIFHERLPSSPKPMENMFDEDDI
ncbi:hypothetical protein LJB86_04320 [Deltaproteobacteria bacterium OttesenSCG-928-M10]|nr:hypothetical protein [Deltaproteobacteria bacterium OttesenSCG-928-M10]